MKKTTIIKWTALNVLSFVAAVLFLLTGCVSMSTMQTARTTEKGDIAGGGGIGLAGYDNGAVDTAGNSMGSISVPFIELYGRYGITDHLDIGAKLTIIGTFLVDGKYQLLGDAQSKTALSAGFGFGFLTMKSENYINKIRDIHIPIYASYHPAEWFALYINPRYVMRMNNSTNYGKKDNYTSNWWGATGGIRLGKKNALFAEYSYFYNSYVPNTPLTQATVGFGIGIK